MLLPCHLLCTFNNIVAVNKTVGQEQQKLCHKTPQHCSTQIRAILVLHNCTGQQGLHPGTLHCPCRLQAPPCNTHPGTTFKSSKTCKNISTCIQLRSSALYWSLEFRQNPNDASACLPPPQIVFPGLNNTPNTSVIPETPDSPHKIVPIL